MNLHPLLFEMIASRAGTNGSPAAAELLGRLRSPSGDNSSPTVEELLTQFGDSNPTASLILRYMANQQALVPSNNERSVTETAPVLVREIAQDASGSDREVLHAEESSGAIPELTELRQQVESMFAELKQFRERNDALAWALGACCLCWGEDPECRACRGRGRPGFAIPDRKWFAEYVLPAMRMLQVKKPENDKNPGDLTASRGWVSRETE
jgi:hypothetical protein